MLAQEDRISITSAIWLRLAVGGIIGSTGDLAVAIDDISGVCLSSFSTPLFLHALGLGGKVQVDVAGASLALLSVGGTGLRPRRFQSRERGASASTIAASPEVVAVTEASCVAPELNARFHKRDRNVDSPVEGAADSPALVVESFVSAVFVRSRFQARG